MRRARGVLEAEVLAVLWSGDCPLTPEDVRRQLGDDLAYTTVMTILARLHEKGAVRREAHGRGYAYAPLLDEAGLAAQRMRMLLDGEDDRVEVLSRFVAGLDENALAAVRRALDEAALDGPGSDGSGPDAAIIDTGGGTS